LDQSVNIINSLKKIKLWSLEPPFTQNPILLKPLNVHQLVKKLSQTKPKVKGKNYEFPTNKLKQASKDKKAVVLVACGSFNPPTNLHLRLFGKILHIYFF
jgi:hypothetical protein